MATELGKAYVQIIPKATGIGGAISSELGGEAASAGKSAGLSLAGALKGAIAAAGIGAALKSALDAGGDLQQSFGGLETLYGDAAAQAKEYAAAAAEAGISANSYAEQAVSFGASLKQAFGGDTVAAAEAANTAILDMADNSAKMGTDVELIQNAYQGFAKQNYTMLDNLKLGYGGTKTEMERLLADAKELSGVEYDINNLGDVYSAIHVIQEDLGLTGVAAKEASTTFTGSFNAMKASAENLMANLALGEDIGPALDQLGTSIQGFLFNNLFPMVGNVLSSLPDLLSGVSSIIIGSLNMISNNADQIVQMGIDFVVALVGAIVTAAPYLIEAAFSLITALGSAIVNTDWAQVGNDIITGIKDALDMAAGEILGQDTATIDGFLQGITAGLPNLLQSGVEIITNLANSIISNLPMMITTAGTLITQFVGFLLQNLPTILQAGASLVLNLVNGIVSNLPQIVASVVKVIASFVATVASNLPTILAQGITIIGKLVAGLIQAIPKIIAAIPQIIQSIVNSFGSYDWGSIGKNILQGIADGISNAVGVVVDAAKNAAQAAFDAAKNLLGIESPSKKGYWIGEMLDLGFANGISENEDLVSSAISDLSTNASTQLLLASKSSTFGYEAGTSSDDKMDILLAMLSNYLPEIAENKGVDVQQLYKGLNRQLGWAIS